MSKNRNSLLMPTNKRELEKTLTNISNILIKNKILNGTYTNRDAKAAIEAVSKQLNPLTRMRQHRNSFSILKNPRIKTKSRKHRNSLNILREKIRNKTRPRTRRRRKSVDRSIYTPYRQRNNNLIDMFGEPSNNNY